MEIIDFFNNPNVGLFFYTTDKFTIIPTVTPDKLRNVIIKELGTELIECNVYNSSVNNLFLTGNSEFLFAPDIISKEQQEVLEKTKMKIVILKTKLNALGNNMIFRKNKVVINPNYEDSVVKKLEELGFKVLKSTIAGVDTVGANLVLFGNKGLVNPDINPKEYNDVCKFLNIECEKGSVNNGSKIVKAGVITNSNGILVSELMSGPEMMNIESLWKNGFKK